jgi:hypothetical protein
MELHYPELEVHWPPSPKHKALSAIYIFPPKYKQITFFFLHHRQYFFISPSLSWICRRLTTFVTMYLLACRVATSYATDSQNMRPPSAQTKSTCTLSLLAQVSILSDLFRFLLHRPTFLCTWFCRTTVALLGVGHVPLRLLLLKQDLVVVNCPTTSGAFRLFSWAEITLPFLARTVSGILFLIVLPSHMLCDCECTLCAISTYQMRLK